jgi:hypothetical protein
VSLSLLKYILEKRSKELVSFIIINEISLFKTWFEGSKRTNLKKLYQIGSVSYMTIINFDTVLESEANFICVPFKFNMKELYLVTKCAYFLFDDNSELYYFSFRQKEQVSVVKENSYIDFEINTETSKANIRISKEESQIKISGVIRGIKRGEINYKPIVGSKVFYFIAEEVLKDIREIIREESLSFPKYRG